MSYKIIDIKTSTKEIITEGHQTEFVGGEESTINLSRTRSTYLVISVSYRLTDNIIDQEYGCTSGYTSNLLISQANYDQDGYCVSLINQEPLKKDDILELAKELVEKDIPSRMREDYYRSFCDKANSVYSAYKYINTDNVDPIPVEPTGENIFVINSASFYENFNRKLGLIEGNEYKVTAVDADGEDVSGISRSYTVEDLSKNPSYSTFFKNVPCLGITYSNGILLGEGAELIMDSSGSSVTVTPNPDNSFVMNVAYNPSKPEEATQCTITVTPITE